MLTPEQREWVLKHVKQWEYVATLTIEDEFMPTPQGHVEFHQKLAELETSIMNKPNSVLAPIQRPPYLLSDPNCKISIIGVYFDVMDENEVDEAIKMSFAKL